MEAIVARYTDGKINGNGAAKKFADSRSRKIGKWDGRRFQFVDGIHWYRLELKGWTWTIVRE